MHDLEPIYAGLLLGGAVGDALGLPAEGMSRERIRRRWKGVWRHRLIFGRGMVSDDTEHTVLVAQSLLEHPHDAAKFQHSLARGLKGWFAALPAGVGLGTARALIKLWLGWPPARAGVHSAGNGPAMRSAILGAFFHGRLTALARYVEASTRLTHTDGRALTGALAVARCAEWIVSNPGQIAPSPSEFETMMLECGRDAEWNRLVEATLSAWQMGLSVDAFSVRLGLPHAVTGYVYHTVPVALYGWLRHGRDYKQGLTSVLNCGGDTDTTGAIAGALLGATSGAEHIPQEWLDGVRDWPLSSERLCQMAHALAERKQDARTESVSMGRWLGSLARNLAFLGVVAGHGVRRMFPPY